VNTPWKALPRKRVRDAPKTVVAIVRFMFSSKVHNYIEKVYHYDTLLVSSTAKISQHSLTNSFSCGVLVQSYPVGLSEAHPQK